VVQKSDIPVLILR